MASTVSHPAAMRSSVAGRRQLSSSRSISRGAASTTARPSLPRQVNSVSAPPRLEEELATAGGADMSRRRPMEILDEMYKDYAVGYRSVDPATAETDGWITEVRGKIPAELTGTLLRNGPALFERDGLSKAFLDGDGMVASLAFKDGRAYFRNKFVGTEGFKKEQVEGRFTELSIFTEADPRPVISGKPMWYHRLVEDILCGPPAPKNNGAYNAWFWGGSLVAVDFGKPHGLDPTSLATVGPYSEFSSSSFTAHSRVLSEPDGSKRMCCFSPYVDWAKRKTQVTFLEFDEAGVKVEESYHEFQAAYFHDMIVTDKWYILFDCPITMDYGKAFVGYPMGKNSLGDTIGEDRSRPGMFRMFPRPGKNDSPPLVVPVEDMWCYAYHHINGFDVTEDGHTVVFDTCTWDKFNLYFEDIIRPDGEATFPRTRLTRFTIDARPGGVATAATLSDRPSEYPTVAPDSAGRAYEHAYMSSAAVHAGEHWHDGGANGPMHSLTKLSLRSTGATPTEVAMDEWYPGDSSFVGEPLFVARPGGEAEDDGWLLVLVHNGEDASTDLAIVDAQRVGEGPLALCRLPAYLPMGVHGSFTEEYILGPDAQAASTA